MKALLAATVGMVGASWYNTRSDAQAWGVASTPAFSQKEFQTYNLVEVTTESHNVKRFRFALQNKNAPLAMPVASCITLRYTDAKGQEVTRPYTPINHPDDKGHFDLVVKCYPNSKMGAHLFSLKAGDHVEAKGPWTTFAISPSKYYRIGMIAGGTGLTPMFQIINSVLHQPKNETQISLLYANVTKDDILLGNELDAYMKEFAGKFATYFCLEKPPSKWTGYSGYINKVMIRETMPGPEHKGDSVILVSGPPPFMKAICGEKDFSSMPPKQGPLGGILKGLGYQDGYVYKF